MAEASPHPPRLLAGRHRQPDPAPPESPDRWRLGELPGVGPDLRRSRHRAEPVADVDPGGRTRLLCAAPIVRARGRGDRWAHRRDPRAAVAHRMSRSRCAGGERDHPRRGRRPLRRDPVAAELPGLVCVRDAAGDHRLDRPERRVVANAVSVGGRGRHVLGHRRLAVVALDAAAGGTPQPGADSRVGLDAQALPVRRIGVLPAAPAVPRIRRHHRPGPWRSSGALARPDLLRRVPLASAATALHPRVDGLVDLLRALRRALPVDRCRGHCRRCPQLALDRAAAVASILPPLATPNAIARR